MNKPLISIYVATFNHEKYIVRALDSIRMQETDYPFEVYVGEDCSTDSTRQILQAWEAEHQDDRFHIFYRKENMHRLPLTNAQELRLHCKGKYIIALEGDDFWTDPKKLQKQADFLQTHPEYYAVAHNCIVVGADNTPNGEVYPECKDTEYTFRHFVSDILPGQLTTFFSRNYMLDPNIDGTFLTANKGAGDRKMVFQALCAGKIYCIQQTMSAYRHITSGGTSFSATNRYRYETEELYLQAFLDYAEAVGNSDALKYAEMLYLRNIRYASRKKLADPAVLAADKKKLRHPYRAAALLLKRDINYRLLHRTLHV